MSRTKLLGDKYQIGEVIGQGSFSTVYRCRELQTQNEYAVRVLNKGVIENRGMEGAFERELICIKSLRYSPYVTNFIEILQSARNYYIVMDLADCSTLLSHIIETNGGKGLAPAGARKYFKQLVQGLADIHACNVVHRDIKPDNLLLDRWRDLKISDFGFAAIAEHDQVLKRQCGTPQYVAPEIILDAGYEGQQADIWSVGVTLYVMFFGQQPFVDSNIDRLYEKIVKGRFQIPKRSDGSYLASEAAIHCLYACLRTNPEQRWTAQQLLNHPWVLGRETLPLKAKAALIKANLQQQQQQQEQDAVALRAPASAVLLPSKNHGDPEAEENHFQLFGGSNPACDQHLLREGSSGNYPSGDFLPDVQISNPHEGLLHGNVGLLSGQHQEARLQFGVSCPEFFYLKSTARNLLRAEKEQQEHEREAAKRQLNAERYCQEGKRIRRHHHHHSRHEKLVSPGDSLAGVTDEIRSSLPSARQGKERVKEEVREFVTPTSATTFSPIGTGGIASRNADSSISPMHLSPQAVLEHDSFSGLPFSRRFGLVYLFFNFILVCGIVLLVGALRVLFDINFSHIPMPKIMRNLLELILKSGAASPKRPSKPPSKRSSRRITPAAAAVSDQTRSADNVAGSITRTPVLSLVHQRATLPLRPIAHRESSAQRHPLVRRRTPRRSSSSEVFLHQLEVAPSAFPNNSTAVPQSIATAATTTAPKPRHLQKRTASDPALHVLTKKFASNPHLAASARAPPHAVPFVDESPAGINELHGSVKYQKSYSRVRLHERVANANEGRVTTVSGSVTITGMDANDSAGVLQRSAVRSMADASFGSSVGSLTTIPMGIRGTRAQRRGSGSGAADFAVTPSSSCTSDQDMSTQQLDNNILSGGSSRMDESRGSKGQRESESSSVATGMKGSGRSEGDLYGIVEACGSSDATGVVTTPFDVARKPSSDEVRLEKSEFDKKND